MKINMRIKSKSKINTTKSKKPRASKLISLVSPEDAEIVSRYEEEILSTLAQGIKQNRTKPVRKLPKVSIYLGEMDCPDVISIKLNILKDLKRKGVVKGFQMKSEVDQPEPPKKPSPLRIQDDNGALNRYEHDKFIYDTCLAGEEVKTVTAEIVFFPSKLRSYVKAKKIKFSKKCTRVKKDKEYWIECKKTRHIILNGKYFLSRPDFMSENDLVFEFLYNHQNQPLKRQQIEGKLKIKLKKKLYQIIDDLGFKGELKKIFFPNVSQRGIEFRNNLTGEDLKDIKVNQKNLREQLKTLTKWKKS